MSLQGDGSGESMSSNVPGRGFFISSESEELVLSLRETKGVLEFISRKALNGGFCASSVHEDEGSVPDALEAMIGDVPDTDLSGYGGDGNGSCLSSLGGDARRVLESAFEGVADGTCSGEYASEGEESGL